MKESQCFAFGLLCSGIHAFGTTSRPIISGSKSRFAERHAPSRSRQFLIATTELQSSSSDIDGNINDDDDDSSNDDSETTNFFYNDLESLFPEDSNEDPSTNDDPSTPTPIQTSTTTPASTPTPTPVPAAAIISDQSLQSSLQKRQNQLQKSSHDLLQKWRTGVAKTFVGFTINEGFYLMQQQQSQSESQSQQSSQSREQRKQRKQQQQQQEDEEMSFDWIRRLSIGSYPRVACGSAHGSIFVADVELGRLLGAAPGVHYPHVGGEDGTIMAAAANPRNDYGNSRVDGLDGRMKEWLYGEYDGGGVLSVAMYGMNLIASAGREGGVKLFRFVEYNGSRSTNNAKEGEGNEEGGLKYVASVPTLLRPLPGAIPILVTCLKFDSMGRLYIGGNDGFLRMVTFPEEYFGGVVDSGGGATSGRKQGRKEMQVTVLNASTGTTPSPILSLDISEDVTSLDEVWIVTSHAHGNVCVHSIKSDYYGDEEEEESKGGGGGGAVSSTFCGMWNPFSSSLSTSDQGKTPSYARSVAFVSRDITQGGSSINDDDTIHDTIDKPFTSKGVVVGGGNGELWVCDIDPSYTATSGGAGGNSASKETTTTTSSPSNTAKNQLFRLDTSRRIGPWHIGPVIAVATRPGGIVISTGHDGMLRVSEVWPPGNNKGNDTSSSDSEATDISSSGPKEVLYGLQGYKVWIGNICIDSEGKRLLSDGRDDIVVVHDFSKDPSEENDDIGDEE